MPGNKAVQLIHLICTTIKEGDHDQLVGVLKHPSVNLQDKHLCKNLIMTAVQAHGSNLDAFRNCLNVLLQHSGYAISQVLNFNILFYVIEKHLLDVFSYLVQNGAPLLEKGDNGDTCLHVVYKSNIPKEHKRSLTNILIKHGANVNETNNEGKLSLCYIADKIDEELTYEIIQMHLEAGVQLHQSNMEAHFTKPDHIALLTALQSSLISSGHSQLIQTLQTDLDVQFRNPQMPSFTLQNLSVLAIRKACFPNVIFAAKKLEEQRKIPREFTKLISLQSNMLVEC